ncbi:hypothetical protein JCM14469_07900 [Desulfatiferula olefinivorans]
MYAFVTGPLLWFSFLFFTVGCTIRVVLYIRGLDWKLDGVTYSRNIIYGIRGAIRSLFFWLIPFGTHSWRNNPGYTLIFFVFHFGLLVTPVFLLAHNIMLSNAWGISLWTLPDKVGDLMTFAVILLGLALLLRRIILKSVRRLTRIEDIAALFLTILPFVTGALAYHQVGHYPFWMITHILSGEILLIAIPLCKLSHFVTFFCSRIQLGIDYGIKRGGMKSGGMDW